MTFVSASFIIPTLAVSVFGAVLGLLAWWIACRIGKLGVLAYVAGVPICLWFGPALWYDLSMAFRLADEPLGPTGRMLSSAFYGAPVPCIAFAVVCVWLVNQRAKAT